MSEKSIVMSISVKPQTQESLKSAAKKAGKSVSEIVRILTEKHLSLVVNDGSDIPVVLRIPSDLRGDEAAIRTWLQVKVDAICTALAKP